MLFRLLNGAASPANCARNIAGPLIVLIVSSAPIQDRFHKPEGNRHQGKKHKPHLPFHFRSPVIAPLHRHHAPKNSAEQRNPARYQQPASRRQKEHNEQAQFYDDYAMKQVGGAPPPSLL